MNVSTLLQDEDQALRVLVAGASGAIAVGVLLVLLAIIVLG